MLKNFIIRNIDPELWIQVKHRAVSEEITIRELVLRAIKQYLKGGK